MPRRDAISEKKKERLMQEHEQLQKLMLQARSSVRRSSLKDEAPADEQVTIEGADTTADLTEPVLHDAPAITKEQPVGEKKMQDVSLSDYRHTTASKPAEQQKPEIHSLHGRSIIVITPPQENKHPVPFQETEDRTNDASIETTAFPETASNNIENEGTILEPDEKRLQEPDELLLAYEHASVKRRRKARVLTYSFLLLAALLAGFGGYYFYQKSGGQNRIIKNQKTIAAPKTGAEKPLANSPGTNSNNETATSANATVTPKPAVKQVEPEAQPATGNETQAVSNSTSLGQFKVLSKAYFHNQPDEGTRRKAFITHWNNAVLTPTEEKNGFVYVVFTNHLGQTSKGWLRKKDLLKLN